MRELQRKVGAENSDESLKRNSRFLRERGRGQDQERTERGLSGFVSSKRS